MATVSQVPQDQPQLVGLASSFTTYSTYVQAQAAAIALSAANSSAQVYTAEIDCVIYGSAPVSAASGTYTITGVPATGQNNIYTINGIAVTCPQTTGNTVTQQATADIAVINANAAAKQLVNATSAAGVVTLTAITPGGAGNNITTTASSSGGDTLTANQTALTGGASAPPIPGGRVDLQPGTPQAWIIQLVSGGSFNPRASSIAQAYTLSTANGNAPVYVADTFQLCTGP